MRQTLSIVIPCFNEEFNVQNLFTRLSFSLRDIEFEKEYIFIDDGSKDGTLQCIKKLAQTESSIKFISFSRNFGHQRAVSAGLQYCKGDLAVIIDADLQDPPELIVDMLSITSKGFDVVYAKRRQRAGESYFKLYSASLFYRILSSITSISIPLDTGDFRLISRPVINVLNGMPEHEKFIRGQVAWAGFNQTFIEYDRDPRVAGNTGYTFAKMLKFALDGITSFSNFPLKFATFSGFFVSVIAFCLIIYTLYSKYILNNYAPGWPSLMISILFLGGIQLICLGIIGEYISRLSDNVRNRPLYIIRETNISEKKL